LRIDINFEIFVEQARLANIVRLIYIKFGFLRFLGEIILILDFKILGGIYINFGF
jgi:hypothetical protein